MKKDYSIYLQLLLLFIMVVMVYIISTWDLGKISCESKISKQDKDELFCTDISNVSSYSIWEIKNRTLMNINYEKELIRKAEQEKIDIVNKACYDLGKDYKIELDIQKDYGYNCKQIEYINNHFINHVTKESGGYIMGTTSGFGIGLYGIGYVSGTTKGEFFQYVNRQVLATGQLVQSTKYHLDCNKIKSNEEIDYYTEQEFVMYYVNQCLK